MGYIGTYIVVLQKKVMPPHVSDSIVLVSAFRLKPMD